MSGLQEVGASSKTPRLGWGAAFSMTVLAIDVGVSGGRLCVNNDRRTLGIDGIVNRRGLDIDRTRGRIVVRGQQRKRCRRSCQSAEQQAVADTSVKTSAVVVIPAVTLIPAVVAIAFGMRLTQRGKSQSRSDKGECRKLGLHLCLPGNKPQPGARGEEKLSSRL